MTTSSPRLLRRTASLNMLYVLPTPGAYPKNSLKMPRALGAGDATSSHSSGFFGKLQFSPWYDFAELQYAYGAPRRWSRNRLCRCRGIARIDHLSPLPSRPRGATPPGLSLFL